MPAMPRLAVQRSARKHKALQILGRASRPDHMQRIWESPRAPACCSGGNASHLCERRSTLADSRRLTSEALTSGLPFCTGMPARAGRWQVCNTAAFAVWAAPPFALCGLGRSGDVGLEDVAVVPQGVDPAREGAVGDRSGRNCAGFGSHAVLPAALLLAYGRGRTVTLSLRTVDPTFAGPAVGATRCPERRRPARRL